MALSKIVTYPMYKAAEIINRLAYKIDFLFRTSESINKFRAQEWVKDDGDQTHRLFYDLNEESVVLDLGGYHGQWSSDMYSMYNCNIMIFEPYFSFFEKIEKRFEKNKKIRVFNYGLGPQNSILNLYISGDGSSLFRKKSTSVEVKIHSIKDFFDSNKIGTIDLMKINIEGAEYELLEFIIETGLINKIKNIQVQFHDFIIPDAESRMRKIQKELAISHDLTYQYLFIWENWKIKNNNY
jgi:FkbM family methyltransferase